jgi:alkylation response protein AidB-like acyl-CoA dehydrogenase
MAIDRTIFEDEHRAYRETVRAFVAREVLPHMAEWDQDGMVARGLFTRAAAVGLLAPQVPEEHGGLGLVDFRFNQVLLEEIAAVGATAPMLGITLHNDVCVPYFLEYCTDEQKARWLPGIADGSLVTAVAMTEPGTGSDLAAIATTARREGDGDVYVVNGSKTFITNGIHADLVITAVTTDPKAKHRGLTLLVLERDLPGFERGRNLEKIGMHSQDTAELFFADVPVPVANRLGAEGEGFAYLVANLAQERMSIAVGAVAAARAALDWTLSYVKDRKAFGQPVGSFQHSRFALAEIATEVEVATTFVDQAVLALNAGTLTPETAAMAKWWCSELQGRVVDRCLQMHGGYGYMMEYPIARAYADARVTRIYGGTTEIMKEIVGRSLGL